MNNNYDIRVLNEEELDKAYNAVLNDKAYGDEFKLVEKVLNQYPKNDDVNIVAMKIALIDVTNSTHLHQHKQNINLYQLAKFITNSQLKFDDRVEKGDETLVNDIARNNGSKNLFSFASKYCYYHNSMVYHGDDYAKYDGIVNKCLPLYAEKFKVKYNNKKITSHTLEGLRKNYNYSDFNQIIKSVLMDIKVKGKIGKFDAVMWYYNRGN